MSGTRYHCCDLRRRNAVAAHPVLNGLEALEVIDRDLPSADPLRQRTLLLYFLKPVDGAGFSRDNVHITGGERVRDPKVEWAEVASLPPPELADAGEADTAAIVNALDDPTQILVVRVANAGDYSRYTLTLTAAGSDLPPADFDPRMTSIEFSFKAECPSDFDCRDTHLCPPQERAAPDIDYLARDYGTFRRLMLDRMAHQVPDWRPDSVADGGVALIELLAYVGDQLAYRQDAISTEAYLGTARRRVSTRRHATLVDYEMHDGCNARVFVHLRLDPAVASLVLPKAGTQFLTRCDRIDVGIASGSSEFREALQQRPVFFEPLETVTLLAAHNELSFHTWSDTDCCLPTGATRATLVGDQSALADHWLLFEEVRGPRTGEASDADPTHRQVVKLTKVTVTTDPVPNPTVTVTEIEWGAADALKFPLCISATRTTPEGTEFFTDISIARGNLVLADHGRTLQDATDPESLGTMPEGRVLTLASDGGHCEPGPRREVAARFHPTLAEGPVTQSATPDLASAWSAVRSTVIGAVPQITLTGTFAPEPPELWQPRRSLLNSDGNARDFVVEVENDGRASLRFGDGRYAERPAAVTVFTAIYRVGNGTAGNVGAEALAHVVGIDVDAIVT
ncbi:MAG: putative baseplate assembly protein, partial [Acidobacteriota bacterium]